MIYYLIVVNLIHVICHIIKKMSSKIGDSYNSIRFKLDVLTNTKTSIQSDELKFAKVETYNINFYLFFV